ncbi:2-oxoacid:acceptor oxidoreductase family protein [Desulfofustis glycolicus]|uniref:2-oxoglutarate ferredoxin oxidoreductase, gamma subunit n=1 Tax=Desulfofustis glycolicus DSM 9705 TaxID=1121409 RepID=A0A1M5UA56_9BACT|nr:2-oxoacid:acceptor oxidoreductase family protein [Desulfofustis glycolicus]MCB2214564.1 2-oxoacid:acceptor oxidoreductase family protein [Desulfobulbaceae bacterium]SHH59798.1 2-oxoglutarate ferredoxin oxidoreductase, gamma subunit [Desulfofustis glycolicus DSM 9705]
MNSEPRYEIRFSGSGGQGIITAAVVLADAVGTLDGKYVCQTQSYGPEARGGKSKAEVVMCAEPIDYPKAMQIDLLLSMTQASCDAYFFDIKPDGLLVVDAGLVEQLPTSRAVAIPFTKIARKEIGRELVANMVALGAIGYLSGQVNLKNLEKTLLSRVPKGTENMNRDALQAGIDEAKKVDLASLPRSFANEWEAEV